MKPVSGKLKGGDLVFLSRNKTLHAIRYRILKGSRLYKNFVIRIIVFAKLKTDEILSRNK